MYSLDGLVTYTGPEERFESVRAFSTLFRNGVAEAVSEVRAGRKGDRRSISLRGIERDIGPALRNAFGELTHYRVPPPYYLMVSLVGVRGLSAPMDEWHSGLPYPHRADQVLLPEMLIDDALAKEEPTTWLRPIFDLLWNAFGQRGSPSFDREGRYVER